MANQPYTPEEETTPLVDYNEYTMGRGEWITNLVLAAIVIFAVAWIFYHSIILSALAACLCVLWPKLRTKQIIAARKQALTLQLKDLMYSLSSSLGAGRSVEQAFGDALPNLQLIYPNPNTDIIVETEIIINRIALNQPVEGALESFAARSHIDEIESFADVFRTAKRTSGNINEVIRNASMAINDKIEIKQEIVTMLTSKRFEANVMSIIPVGLVAMLSMSSPDYMEPVFTTIAGRIIMTVAIAIFVVAYLLGQKIMNIEV